MTADELNLQVLQENLNLIRQNQRIILENEERVKLEHQKRLEILFLQKRELEGKIIPDPTPLVLVEEFHTLFGVPVVKSPQIPTLERCMLRVKLIQEELNELQSALDSQDITEVIDALADLQYVLSGSILEFGMKDSFRAAFEEVHRSNMSKACMSKQEANKQ